MLYLFASLLGLAAANLVGGHYVGSKSIMFYHIKVDMKTDTPVCTGSDCTGHFSLSVKGAPSGDVDCAKEAFALSGGKLTLPNGETAGDCAHDQFKAAKLVFQGADYDEAADTVTVHAKYLFVTVTIVCKKVTAEAELLALESPQLDEEFEEDEEFEIQVSSSSDSDDFALSSAADLVGGHYYGTKKIMFYNIKVDMKTDTPVCTGSDCTGHFSLSVKGAPSGDVDCANEAFALSGGKLTLPNGETAGDCAHDQFKAAKLVFQGADYDEAADTVTVHAKYLFITVTIVCKKVTAQVDLEGPGCDPHCEKVAEVLALESPQVDEEFEEQEFAPIDEEFALESVDVTLGNPLLCMFKDKLCDMAVDAFSRKVIGSTGGCQSMGGHAAGICTRVLQGRGLFKTLLNSCEYTISNTLDLDDLAELLLEDSSSDMLGAPSAAPRDFRNPNFQRLAGCANSPNRQHTRAQAVVKFENSCADVSAEIQARVNGQQGWRDPHNRGNYQMESVQGNTLKLKRRTGNNRYTDQVSFVLNDAGANAAGCNVQACSVSQSNSNNDAGTNMCNMANLFCNKNVRNNNQGVACKSLTKDLTYTVANMECGRFRNDGRYREHNCQDFATTCLKQPAMFKVARLE